MYDIKQMIDDMQVKLRLDPKYKDMNDKKINKIARVKVYEYFRYEVPYKTRVLSFDEYCTYMWLESSILFSDINYGRKEITLKNGYDHLYSELQPLFWKLNEEERKSISYVCLKFAKDIDNFKYMEDLINYEPIKTYVRFIVNRYYNVVYAYNLDKTFEDKCKQILDIVGRNKKEMKKK